MEKLWRKHKIVLFALLAAASLSLLVMYRYYTAKSASETAKTESMFSKTDQKKTAEQLSGTAQTEKKQSSAAAVVDVKGAVRAPGIYRMNASDRVVDAIRSAGGLTEKADGSQINLARKVADEMVVYVPEKGEKESPILAGPPAADSAAAASGGSDREKTVNINTADEQGMQDLPGIGPAKAKAIVAYRNEHGPFKTVDELTNVSGIGEKSLEKIKPSATVN
ncbi:MULTISPECIES: helix-hairpin-helix domain-containing protein [unclassified Sporolactobacillus]|uniref:helix-hairpin-helix domain-containing protein n=1 Tax=unclassified Sporolactobacillus TaxID=2628533 RepID=UPI00236875E1|nr:helix-hairpin-helix domain-containing protein [Sporolactobacillus sp. CQH2019]MDD9147612.1 helix-hairpin-helix domain-containing protein [Sporolactobacillus sp. CQH2019]